MTEHPHPAWELQGVSLSFSPSLPSSDYCPLHVGSKPCSPCFWNPLRLLGWITYGLNGILFAFGTENLGGKEFPQTLGFGSGMARGAGRASGKAPDAGYG
jgi:hypothetical protein